MEGCWQIANCRTQCQSDSEVHGGSDGTSGTQDNGDCGQWSHLQSAFCSGDLFFAGLSGLRLSGIILSSHRRSGELCFFLFPWRAGPGLSGIEGFAAARAVQWNRVGQITNAKFGPTVWAVQQMDCHVILIRKNHVGPCDLRPAGRVLQILAVFGLKVSRRRVRISG
jgi:hypothetical protein